MNLFRTCLRTAFLLAALLSTRTAQAMEIFRFDLMADADQDEYVAELGSQTSPKKRTGCLLSAKIPETRSPSGWRNLN
jgi:hypothetical protein